MAHSQHISQVNCMTIQLILDKILGYKLEHEIIPFFPQQYGYHGGKHG